MVQIDRIAYHYSGMKHGTVSLVGTFWSSQFVTTLHTYESFIGSGEALNVEQNCMISSRGQYTIAF